jgi:NADH dehydrogenase [ubiquinone] 1 alpha subcomplex assembly factor 3
MEQSIFHCARTLSRTVQPNLVRSIAPATSQCTLPRQSTQPCQRGPARCLHTTRPTHMQSKPPKSRDRGPKSNEDTQTDFRELDVLRNTIAPATSIDACTSDGFALNNQVRISDSGILLIGGEAFRWWPWAEGPSAGSGSKMKGKLLNAKGQWEVQQESWGALELVYPKPGTYG